MDFNKLTKKELEEIFKKNTSNFKEMNYQEFQNVLPIIAKLMY